MAVSTSPKDDEEAVSLFLLMASARRNRAFYEGEEWMKERASSFLAWDKDQFDELKWLTN